MAENLIKIKRSIGSGVPTLKQGELAYSADVAGGATTSGILYIGQPADPGTDANATALVIGGTKFTNLLGATAGTASASKAVILNSDSGVSGLGNVGATTFNKVTITAPANGSTLTVADGKTLTASNSVTFTATDTVSAPTVAFGAGGNVAYTSNKLSAFASTTSAELAGVISDETGTGLLVFATSPTLTTPNIGAATATSVNNVAITSPGAEGSATLTLANGSTLATSGAFSTTLTATATTTLTLPTSGTLATEAYVDSVAQGLDIKASVRLATTGNILLTGVVNVDGSNTTTGDRILVKSQTTASENGIYVANDNGSWARAADMDGPNEFAGAFTFVEAGASLADTGWVCTNNGPVTIGTTSITFTQFSQAGVITAGTALAKDGNTLNVQVDGTSIDAAGAGATGSLQIKDKGVTYAKIQDVAGLSVIGNSTNTSGVSAAITAGADHNILRRNGTALAFGSIDLSQSGAVGSSVLGATNGGTAQSSYAAGDILYASDTNVLSKRTIGTAGEVLTVVGGVPTWAALPAQLPSQTGNTGKYLKTNGSTASWEAAVDSLTATGALSTTGAATTGALTISVATASNTIAGVASFPVTDFSVTGGGAVSLAAAVVKSVIADGPTTATPSSNAFTIAGNGGAITTSAAGSTVTISVADAGTGTKGVASFSNTNFAVSLGAQVTIKSGGVTATELAVDSVTATAMADASVELDTATVTGTLPVAKGGTGAASLTSGQVVIGNGTSAVSQTANLSFVDNTQTLTVGSGTFRGATGGAVTVASTGDQNIILNPGAGSISASTSKIINVANPTSAQDAATKSYVDTAVATIDGGVY